MHLRPDELVDVVDGDCAESARRHLQSCEMCRQQLADLQSTMAAVTGVDLPEPSPLFWQHLSGRVREVIAAEEPRQRAHVGRDVWHAWSARMWPAGVLVGVAAVALVISLTPRTLPSSSAPDGQAGGPAVDMPRLQPFGSVDEPSLALVGDLTAQMDGDAATETGMTSRVGGVDEFVASLTDDERVELRRLLKEALAKPGA